MRSDDPLAGLSVQTVRITFICTANRARSPFAAALLHRQLHGLPVDVQSFGMVEQGGAPALPVAVRVASVFGIDLATHRARALATGELAGTALAIGFEPAHVAAAVSTGGVSVDRAFLLAELADVLELDVLPWPANSRELGARIAHADARRFARGRLPRSIADPVGGSERQFQQTYEEIDRMVAIIAMRLFGADGAPTD